MKIIAVLADGTEELEAVAVIDIMRRLGAAVTVAGLEKLNIVAAQHSRLAADRLLADCSKESFDAVFLPGGAAGAGAMRASSTVRELLLRTYSGGGVVSAICAAPIALAAAGLLDGRRFTVYPGFEEYLNGLQATGRLAERDGRVVTGRGPGAVFAFAAELAAALGAGDEIKNVYKHMFVEL